MKSLFAIAVASVAMNAAALPLQREIDAAAARGGGEVVVPPGEHRTGGLWLKSNVSLVIPKGARLIGSVDSADYPRDRRGALIFAENVTNIAVRGEGVVDGSGASFPVQNDSATRPRLLHFVRCRDVAVEGVTLQNSPSWTCFLQECESVRVKRVKIDAHANFNNDGLDVESKDVLVEDCDIDSDDDAMVMASALLELSTFADGEKGAAYRAFAVKQLLSLTSPAYFSEGDEIGHWLLKHGL